MSGRELALRSRLPARRAHAEPPTTERPGLSRETWEQILVPSLILAPMLLFSLVGLVASAGWWVLLILIGVFACWLPCRCAQLVRARRRLRGFR